jgi:hypothetical protein
MHRPLISLSSLSSGRSFLFASAMGDLRIS